MVYPKKINRYIWEDRQDFPLQVVEELFQFALVTRHAKIEPVYSVFHIENPF